MSFYKKVTYGAVTGEQTIIPVDPSKRHTVTITPTGSTVDLDVVLDKQTSTGQRTAALAGVTAPVVKTIDSGVSAIGVDISVAGTSTVLEIFGADQ